MKITFVSLPKRIDEKEKEKKKKKERQLQSVMRYTQTQKTRMAIAKLFAFHANSKRKKTRMTTAKLFAFHANVITQYSCSNIPYNILFTICNYTIYVSFLF